MTYASEAGDFAIALGGDCMLTRRLAVYDEPEFLALAQVFRGCDAGFVNLETVVRRLHHMLRPGAYMLALFHSEERAETIATYSYRISDRKTITLGPRGRRRPAQYFNNRSLEKLFQEFESVKFFLTRDHLREVIVRR